ncbi:MAG: Rne/Rng family ribonuclease [Candidatus Omnitrophica bacterium]|nr:Rne/Rng family ribonuclease [Candidatus Omnitrophota bacterium]
MPPVREIFISADAQETRVAITEDKRLDEFYVERPSDIRMVGSIYKGRITSVVPGIGAAFVDIGLGKNGFLYVADIVEPKPDEDADLEDEASSGERSERSRPAQPHRRSRIEEVVKVNQELLVQVVKEPFGTKGARLTTHISLPGRYMVLMCNDSRHGISKRIEDPQERSRLRAILNKLRFSDEAGLIIRTAGVGKGEKEFARDVRYLSRIYQHLKRTAARSKAPVCVHQEYAVAQRVIRDSFTEDTHRVVVDSKEQFRSLRHFLQDLIPGVKVRLDLHQSEQPLFEQSGLTEQIEAIFDKLVQLPSGGSIVVEPTEGMVAIDVNTAKFTGRRNLEDTAFQVDREAAIEVARQLRLRDIGGIVVIDFIDLDIPTHRRELVQVLEEALSRDRAKTNLVSFSEICVAELTRQRMRRSVETVSYQSCPYCHGRGRVKSVLTMAIEAIRQARRALKNAQHKSIELLVHPQVAVRLLQEDRPSLSALEAQTHSKILVLSDPSLHLEQVNVQVTGERS